MHFYTSTGWKGAVVAVLLHASSAWADDAAPALSPDRAVALSLTAHPDLRTTEVALSTAEASRSAAALFLSNPSVDAWTTPDAARADLGVSQPLSLTGEGWHARRGAARSADSARATLRRARRELAANVRLAYAEAVVAAGVVGVAREGLDLAGRLRFGVQRRHEEGEASALDLRLARLAEVQAAARLLEARRREVAALRGLSSWTLTPVTAADLATDPLVVVPLNSPLDVGQRSDVVAADAALEAARAGLRRARAAIVPPLSVGIGAEVEGGAAFVGPSVGLTLPIFDRNQVGRAQASGAVAVAEGRLARAEAMAEIERVTSSARLAEAEVAAETVVEGGLEEARAALASIEAGVLAGEIDLATAVLLQVQVLEGEAAVFTLRGLLADAHIDRLLALDADALLGGAR